MVKCFMYLVTNLLPQFANFMRYFFDSIDLVDFFTYVLLISSILFVIYFINHSIRRINKY